MLNQEIPSQGYRQHQGVNNLFAKTISRTNNFAPNLNPNPNSNFNPITQTSFENGQQQLIRSQSPNLNNANSQAHYSRPTSYTLAAQDRVHLKQQFQQHQARHFRRSSNLHQDQNSLGLTLKRQAMLNRPLCRCRVMYLGSSVPHITKNGLHGIQEPLRHLYPEEQFGANLGAGKQLSQEQAAQASNTIDISHLSSSLGIDSWLSVWSNGLLLENVDEFGREIKRFFSIDSLHYCAAVRYFDTSRLMSAKRAAQQDQNNNHNHIPAATNPEAEPGAGDDKLPQQQQKRTVRFLPLDAPLFQCPGMIDSKHPPVFASIMRRTTGIKVLECHAFICRRDAASNALVRCCTQAYADLLNAKRLSVELTSTPSNRFIDCQRPPSDLAARHLAGSSYNPVNNQKFNADHSMPTRHLNEENGYQTVLDTAPNSLANANGTTANQNSSHSSCNSNQSSSSNCEQQANELDQLSIEEPASESDQNYAIISRSKRSDCCAKEAPDTQGLKPISGSSRSLYDDFTPNGERFLVNQLKRDQLHRTDSIGGSGRRSNKRLSHSLEFFELANDSNCCRGDQFLGRPSGKQLQSYAIIKRHSKSMQNLDGTYGFAGAPEVALVQPLQQLPSSMRPSNDKGSRSGRSRARQHRRQVSGNFQPDLDPKKAQSYQDMRLTRTNSVGSHQKFSHIGDAEQRNSRQALAPCCSEVAAAESGKIKTRSKSVDRRSQSKSHDRQRSCSRRKNSSQDLPDFRRDSIKLDPYQQQQQLVQSQLAYQAQFPPAMFQHAPPHMMGYPLAAPFLGPHPLYMSPAGMAYHHHPHAFYEAAANPAYLQPVPLQAYMQMHHGPYYQQQQQHLVAQANLQKQRRKQEKSQQNSTKLSITSRFRCLSPPINFLSTAVSSSSNANPSQPSGSASQQGAPSGSCPDSQRHSTDSPAASLVSSPRMSGEIVTGQPSFLATKQEQRKQDPQRQLTAPQNQKKMGWIKRLSLTMTGGSYRAQGFAVDEHSDPSSNRLSTDPSGQGPDASAAPSKRTKRRSSLFSGSLTLGRQQSKQHAKMLA